MFIKFCGYNYKKTKKCACEISKSEKLHHQVLYWKKCGCEISLCEEMG